MEPRLGPSTFEQLWNAHAERLLAFFARRTLDPEVSLDLVAETFAAAFVGRRRFRGSTSEDEAAFLHGIARRQLAHWYRRAAVQRRASARLALERPLIDDESYARIEELARSAPQREAVRAALEALDEQQRRVLRLRIVEERGYADVAAALGTSEQTARARVSRALRALDRALAAAETSA
ncbi:MAG: sigma-70 family RNA polymerase sigma factor [Solirubrobacteraceae bacterium]|nr:sigma-70 family RNA polymerase sigma factor [Solirubrobacteraceae bacterium]